MHDTIRGMAIRFHCGACSQPIEIDDEWASKLVACPFCRKTIVAPAESTPFDLTAVPVAKPIAPVPALFPTQPQPHAQPSSNRLAVVALVLAWVTVLLVVVYLKVSHDNRLEIQTIFKPGGSFSDQVRRMSEMVDAQGGRFPSWYTALLVSVLSAGMCWVATLVCGLMAIRRPRRRGLALAALLISGLVPVLLCCTSGLGLAQ